MTSGVTRLSDERAEGRAPEEMRISAGLYRCRKTSVGSKWAKIKAMPGVTKYNLVDDAQDLRIPMHNEEVFKHGVCFEAKVRSLCNRLYFLGSISGLKTSES